MCFAKSMLTQAFAALVLWTGTLCGVSNGQNLGRGSTVEGDIARGEGAFLSGVGWYNLRTAQAASVNVDSAIRWKADLRKIQQEARELEAQKKYQKNMNIEQVRGEWPSARRSCGQVLRRRMCSRARSNALVYDLTDPDITSSQWRNATAVALPPDMSVKELIFRFTPHKVSTQASAALSRGVIALSRLDIKDRWPALLKKDELAKERKAYEDAYIRVREKLLKGEYAIDEILRLDAALDGLQKRIDTEIPTERGFRTVANKFVEDLREATRMFDANSVDYAREILADTTDHDAANVEELVAFMTKYRLQFS